MEQYSIGDRLRDLRTSKGVNQDQAAESCGISRIALARYETGARIPRAEIVTKLADYYGVSVDYLLCREGATANTDIKEAPADTKADKGAELFAKLNDESKAQALQYMEFLMQKQ